MQQANHTEHSQQIPQKYWSKLLRQDYIIRGCTFQLSSEQVTTLIKSESINQLNTILTQLHKDLITSAISHSPTKALYPKVNGRTPKDLPLINRQIHKPADLISILHASEYILETIHQGRPAQIVLRQYIPQLIQNKKVYRVIARGGFVIGIGQKYCDHIQQQPSADEITQIFDIAQQIMPAITLATKKQNGHQLNAFVISLHLSQPSPKITSVYPYPSKFAISHSILSESQLETYYSEITKNSLHKSTDQFYQLNEGVIPLIRTIKNQQDIKHYDMGEYLMGNQIDNQHKLKQWKQFIKQSQDKLNK